MNLKEYNPINDEIFRLLDNEGMPINKKKLPEMDNDMLTKSYKDMLFVRIADIMAVSYQRQGRMFTYPLNLGQEAISVALGKVMKPEDWLVPAFRELGAWLAKGVTLKEIFMYFMGYEEGNAFLNVPKLLPISVPIASQLTHAAGIAYAVKMRKENDVVFAVVGDGGTSQGDFHEALNFAAVWKVPVVFIVQNNQFAISVPISKQTISVNIAVKSVAYGMPGIKIDGNDFIAMYSALSEASEYARAGNGPILIEALTYRKGAHTTSDDPTKYRTKENEEEWEKTDPLKRLGAFLRDRDLWSDEEERIITEQFKKEVDRQFEAAEATPAYSLEDVFKYTYVDMPEDLRLQQKEHEKFLKWKEAQI